MRKSMPGICIKAYKDDNGTSYEVGKEYTIYEGFDTDYYKIKEEVENIIVEDYFDSNNTMVLIIKE